MSRGTMTVVADVHLSASAASFGGTPEMGHVDEMFRFTCYVTVPGAGGRKVSLESNDRQGWPTMAGAIEEARRVIVRAFLGWESILGGCMRVLNPERTHEAIVSITPHAQIVWREIEDAELRVEITD